MSREVAARRHELGHQSDNDGLMTCASPTTCPSGTGALQTSFDPLLPRPISSTSGVVTDQYEYNAYGELASYEAFAGGNLVFSEVMDTPSAPRDDLGRIVEETETLMGVTTDYRYEYDLQGRLVRVFEDGVLEQEYTYDDNGNRLSLTTPEGTITATYDDQDRLLSYGDLDFTYTANGELLTKTDTSTGDMWAYEYDVRGNLVRVDLPDGRVIEYLVDGQDRRVGKLVDGVLTKQWVWQDQLRIAAELDGSGNLESRFVYGEDAGTTPELVIQGSTVYRVVSDHLGSVRALANVDSETDVPVLLDYDVFGSVAGTGVGVVPQGFAGGLQDSDSGLVRFGARDYDPANGRWLSKDPLGIRDNSSNVFVYVKGDPINHVDPDGARERDIDPECRDAVKRQCRAGCRFACGSELCVELCEDWALNHFNWCENKRGKHECVAKGTLTGTCSDAGQYSVGPSRRGQSEYEACTEAKHALNDTVPLGCYARHVRCICTKR